jgi:hypothetical protein
MTSPNVSIGFSDQPNQVLDAYRKIEEAAKRANKELRSMADVDFPGLEDARDELEAINRGSTQMFSKLVRGPQAEALRSGGRGDRSGHSGAVARNCQSCRCHPS